MTTYSVRASSACTGSPSAPQDEKICPPVLISYRECNDISLGKKLEIKCTKPPSESFGTFMESSSKAEIVAFFREVEKELESKRNIWDFHMRLMDSVGDFKVLVYYGLEKVGPSVLPLSDCISCSPNALLFRCKEASVEARECVLEEFSDDPYAVCRLDAKGRCGFIITPVRHVNRMSELDDEELFRLWSLAGRVLREAKLPFTSMILNHGTYRNVEHLHLKVWVNKELFQQYQVHWSSERQELWKQLQEIASKRSRK